MDVGTEGRFYCCVGDGGGVKLSSESRTVVGHTMVVLVNRSKTCQPCAQWSTSLSLGQLRGSTSTGLAEGAHILVRWGLTEIGRLAVWISVARVLQVRGEGKLTFITPSRWDRLSMGLAASPSNAP